MCEFKIHTILFSHTSHVNFKFAWILNLHNFVFTPAMSILNLCEFKIHTILFFTHSQKSSLHFQKRLIFFNNKSKKLIILFFYQKSGISLYFQVFFNNKMYLFINIKWKWIILFLVVDPHFQKKNDN